MNNQNKFIAKSILAWNLIQLLSQVNTEVEKVNSR